MNNLTPLESYTAHIKDKDFLFEIYEEDHLGWQQYNEIHRALNLAYGSRTKSFTKKSFGHCTPKIRVLCRYQGELVGHTAAFENHVIVNSEKIIIGGVGLTLSLMPDYGLGFLLRKKAVEICAKDHCVFAVGRVENHAKVRKNLATLVSDFWTSL